MKKLVFITFIFFPLLAMSQTLEFGPTLGLHASSIDDANFFIDKPSIGKRLWNVNKGFQTILYFKDPKQTSTGAITLNFHNTDYGVRSDKRQNFYSYNTNSFDIGYRFSGFPDYEKNIRAYLEAGLGINLFDTSNYYHGLTEETDAFPELKEAIALKDKELKLVLGLGFDFNVFKDFICFTELKASGGFTNITQNDGAYIDTYFQLNTGLRYIVNFKKKESKIEE
ncbi:hypothetical protein [Flavobacterium urocaniciphilum]|uniref:Outer membrane protein beta-barrel domain-containing protein n=1 Tax=Flavobacterium urocaniciphilum TaxID=1299341 RepID=A0A1H9AQV0_9FLAO|nr:hypothetical protein [Flavobacterium urocaniciphilum]SEP78837.1 hypothetical protein SAMN05444005_102277 [Flavobacterium urocaniciphilum]